MDEYISRERVQQIIEHIITKYAVNYNRKEKWTQFWADTVRYFDKKVKAVPAADVAEVRHGEWVSNGFCCNRCSCCGKIAPFNSWGYQYCSAYCPHCGAKMNGKDEEQ